MGKIVKMGRGGQSAKPQTFSERVENPLVSVVIPVYNVEKYLRECLDSVVNQTMRDLQIICINDGSPDNSRTILQEYADKDNRIQIIDKENGGVSAARNAAYPYIKGKYTLFVDSDDWIDLQLCEKVYAKAEETGADMTVFFYQREPFLKPEKYLWNTISEETKFAIDDKVQILNYPSVWGKIYLSEFLLQNKIFFPEGLAVGEDACVTWKSVIHAKHIAVIQYVLYHYRDNESSVMGCSNKKLFDIIPVYGKVLSELQKTGLYDAYKRVYHKFKLTHIYFCYKHCSDEDKQAFRELISQSLTDDDYNAVKSLSFGKRRFYHSLNCYRTDGTWAKRLLKRYIIDPFTRKAA